MKLARVLAVALGTALLVAGTAVPAEATRPVGGCPPGGPFVAYHLKMLLALVIEIGVADPLGAVEASLAEASSLGRGRGAGPSAPAGRARMGTD